MVSSAKVTDVFIVGGGPAGLAVAIAARQKGLRAIVADGAAPPIEKPCGEGMMPETLGALRDLGVEIPAGQGQKFRGICFAQPQGARVAADFPQGPGIGLRRPLLHEQLISRAKECGAKMLWNTTVLGMDAQSVHLTDGRIHARWIVGTDGQGSRVRRWSGLEAIRINRARYSRRRHYRVKPWSSYVEIYWSSHAQAYVTPIGRDEICIGVMAERAEDASFDRTLRELPDLRDKLGGAELSGRERGAVTAMRSLCNVQRGNVALAGDASGGVDAITGDGLRLAFRQALLLADAMAAGSLRPYQQAHRQLARGPMRIGNLMLWLGRNPRIRSRVIRALQSKPDLFARLLATHVGQGSSADPLSTGALLGWRLLAI